MDVISIISPLILVSLLGYLCSARRLLTREHIGALSKFTFNLCIPAFLFLNMATASLEQSLRPEILATFYLPVLLVWALAWCVNYWWHPKEGSSAASAVFALGASYSNNLIVGLPLIVAAFGQQASTTVFVIVTFHSAMLFGLTSVVASLNTGKRFDLAAFGKNVLINPLILGITAGMAFNFSGLELPTAIENTLGLLAKPAITCALFILGATLSYYRIRSQWQFTTIASIAKLLLLPLLVYLFASQVFTLAPQQVAIVTLMAGCPTGVNAYLIASNVQAHQETLASTVVLTTLLSSVTLSGWLMWLLPG